jgi:anti-sigma factor RsiW
MNCEQARRLIQPYADGELDAAGILELEPHLRDCRECALAWRNVQGLKKALAQDALYFTAPKELRRSLTAELRAQAGGRTRRMRWSWSWLAAASYSTALACVVFLLAVTFVRPSAQQQLAQEVTSCHIRSLMAGHELDVISTDQHTVKPWFAGKLDFSPPVKDLAGQGFPLTGGRLDYLGGHAAAALVFQRNKHVINLFVWPTTVADARPVALAPIQGYNLVHWSQARMNFWAVSDLNEAELMEFAEAYGK